MALESLWRLRQALEGNRHAQGPDPLIDALLDWLREADADIARQLPAFADTAPAPPADLTDDRPMTRTEVARALGVHPDTVSRLSRPDGPLVRVGRRITRQSVRDYLRGDHHG